MWFDSNYTRRLAVAVDCTALGADADVDVSLAISSEADPFWGVVQSTGYDVRFASHDGLTLLAHKRTAWNYSAKSATLEVDAYPGKASAMCMLWMYFGYATATDGATSPTIASAKTGTLFMGRPRDLVTAARRESIGSTNARVSLAKTSNEEVRLWWDFRKRLMPAASAIRGSKMFEEIRAVTGCDVQNAGEASQASMFDVTKTVFVDNVVSTWLKGGTSGSDYMIHLRVLTSLGRVLEARQRVRVRNVEV